MLPPPSSRIWRSGIPRTTAPTEPAATELVIDLGALASNWQMLRDRAGGATCAGMVKANAYGLGVRRVAPALWQAGCRNFFTANMDGAVMLRTLVPQARVHVLNGLLEGGEEDMATHGVIPVLNDLGQIERWSAWARRSGRELPAAIHIDTGMNRLGLPPYEVEALAARPELLQGLDIAHVMSHLACADEADHPMNRRQLDLFNRLRAMLPALPASLANSSGIFLGRDYHFDMVRPGYAVYGGNPTPEAANPMAPVVTLRARIIQVREVGAGESVGYGGHFTAQRPTRVATIPVGYADGYLRSLSGQGSARIGEIEIPVIGRVSMDLVTLDISAVPDDKAVVGTWVELIWGSKMLDELARRAGTIGYELLTALGGRYPRVYRSGENA
ncbi:MAG: alanine racemase [Proteobacteria bacterium]|nr:alanine racemase [Pseudomonadota bacterium]